MSSTYVKDLETLAYDISQTSTNELVQQVRDDLKNAVPISEATLERMVIHLADLRGMSRLALVDSFGKIGSSAVPKLMIGLKTCPNPVVRRSCGKALAKIGDSSATDALLHTLVHDEDRVTRASASGALAKMGATAVPKLLRLISNTDISMSTRGHAAWAIAYMQGSAGDALFAAAKDPSDDVRIAVVSALGAVAIGDALPTMGSASSSDDWGDEEKRNLADKAIKAMREALNDECAGVKAEAATALANVGCVEEGGRIADMLTDDDMELRRCAALALMKLRDTSYIGVLKERAEDDREVESVRNVAKLAATTLERTLAEEDDDWD